MAALNLKKTKALAKTGDVAAIIDFASVCHLGCYGEKQNSQKAISILCKALKKVDMSATERCTMEGIVATICMDTDNENQDPQEAFNHFKQAFEIAKSCGNEKCMKTAYHGLDDFYSELQAYVRKRLNEHADKTTLCELHELEDQVSDYLHKNTSSEEILHEEEAKVPAVA